VQQSTCEAADRVGTRIASLYRPKAQGIKGVASRSGCCSLKVRAEQRTNWSVVDEARRAYNPEVTRSKQVVATLGLSSLNLGSAFAFTALI
jgi:hypothetical protein